MRDAVLPRDVLAFLRERIESYQQLEILLLLRARPERRRSVRSIAAELRLPEASAVEACHFLQQQELACAVEGTGELLVVYGPVCPELDGTIGQLAMAYAGNRIDVASAMAVHALDRFRSRASRILLDAILSRKGTNQRPSSARSGKGS